MIYLRLGAVSSTIGIPSLATASYAESLRVA